KGAQRRRRDALSISGEQTCLNECRSIERPRGPADRRHESMPCGAEKPSRRHPRLELPQQPIYGPEPDHEVLAVIPVAKDDIEPRQIRLMAPNEAATSLQ